MQERKKKEYIFLLRTFRKNLNLVKKRNACSEVLEDFFIFSHKKLVGGGGGVGGVRVPWPHPLCGSYNEEVWP